MKKHNHYYCAFLIYWNLVIRRCLETLNINILMIIFRNGIKLIQQEIVMKDIDSSGNTYIQKQAWYKRWWIWLIIIILVLIAKLLFFDMNSDTDDKTNFETASGVTTVRKTHPKYLSYEDENYSIKAIQEYKLNYVNNSWKNAQFKVNKVEIYKTKGAKKIDDDETGKINGFARIYLTVKAKRKIYVYATQGEVTLSNLEHVDVDNYDEDWDGKIKPDVTKSGHITVPIKKLKDPADIKSLVLKFSASLKEDDDYGHMMNLTLHLRK